MHKKCTVMIMHSIGIGKIQSFIFNAFCTFAQSLLGNHWVSQHHKTSTSFLQSDQRLQEKHHQFCTSQYCAVDNQMWWSSRALFVPPAQPFGPVVLRLLLCARVSPPPLDFTFSFYYSSRFSLTPQTGFTILPLANPHSPLGINRLQLTDQRLSLSA